MTMNSEERRHIRRVIALGCIVCGAPAELHHIRSLAAGSGTGLKVTHFETIGLCPSHHRTGGYGIAFHAGPEIWEKTFGRQEDLLAQILKELSLSNI